MVSLSYFTPLSKHTIFSCRARIPQASPSCPVIVVLPLQESLLPSHQIHHHHEPKRFLEKLL